MNVAASLIYATFFSFCMRFSFYPVDINYVIKEGKPLIQLFGRTGEGEQICLIDHFEPYFYVKGSVSEEDLLALEKDVYKVVRVEPAKRRIDEKEQDVLKVFTNLPKAVPVIKDIVRDLGAECFEYDVLFARRYLIDKGITPMSEIIVEGERIAYDCKTPTYSIRSFEPGTQILAKPDILAFDIETYNPEGKALNPRKYPIITIALYGDSVKKVLTWKEFSASCDLEVCKSEADMLQRFMELVGEASPDIIVGYFSDGFDFHYIRERARALKLKLPLGLDFSELLVAGRAFKEAKIAGVAHVDIFKFIRKVVGRSLDTDVYTLNAVAGELLGAEKHDVDLDRLAYTWDNHPAGMSVYADYNLQDAKLTYDLCWKVFPNLLELVRVIGLPIYDIDRMSFSQLVEWYLIKKSQEFNEMIANRPSRSEEVARFDDRIKGAFVYEPRPGLYNDIVVCDYRSLYPSIIASLNISRGTLNCDCCPDADRIETERGTFWFCQKNKGLFSSVISDLIVIRAGLKKEFKKDKDPMLAARIEALKVIANSFYGYLGFAPARWYCKECAEATTAWARHYIHKAIDWAEAAGFKVLYGDTDSIFLLLEGHSKEDAVSLVAGINDKLPGLMELEFEGFYPSGIFVSLKAAETGAKKKYALIDDKGIITIKGFETVRRNWSFIAKEVQKDVIEIILKDQAVEEAKDYVRKVVEDLRDNRIPVDKVIIRTQLTKSISDYAAIGPHVAAAQMMKEKGSEPSPGTIVEYVICKGKGRIRDKVALLEDAAQCDYDGEYYVQNQIIPGVERIFAVLGISVDELSEPTKQEGLGKFF